MLFEIIVDCIMALGALATAANFYSCLKKSEKELSSRLIACRKMAEMYSRHYQLERI